MRHLRGGKSASSLRGGTDDPQIRHPCPKCEAPRGWRCTYQVGPQTKPRQKVHEERKALSGPSGGQPPGSAC